MKKFHITPSVVYWKKFQREQHLRKMQRNRVDPYLNMSHFELEQIRKYGYKKILFDALPQIAKDFTAGFNLYENELPHMGPFLLESAAYKTMLLIANKDDYHYRLNMDSLFTNGIIDNLIRCCRVRHWTSLRIQAVETFHIFIRRGTTAQNEELLRHAVVPCLMQMLNDEDAIDLDDDDWLYDNVIVEVVKTLALLSTRLDVGGILVRAFVEQNLCGRLMLLFRNPTHTVLESVLTFVENFLTRGNADQKQVLLDNQVLHHLRLVTDNPEWDNEYLLTGQDRAAEALGNFARHSISWRDLVVNNGADVNPLFEVLRCLLTNAVNLEQESMRVARTIGYLCFGTPSPPFDKLRPSIPILRFLINQVEPDIGERAHPAIKHACLIIAYLARGGLDPINALIEGNMCPMLVMLLAHPNSEVVASVLKVVESFLKYGTADQIQVLHDNQVLQRILEILINHNHLPPLEVRSACRVIANIATYQPIQIQSMVDAAIYPSIIQISINQEVGETKYEATYAISAAAKRGSHEQIRYLVDQGAIEAISGGLLSGGYGRRASCFQGLHNILRVGEAHKVDGVNVYKQMVIESGGLARIKSQRDDADVGEMARRLLTSYWPGESMI